MITPTDNMVTMVKPESPAAEGYRALRTNITLRDFDKKIKVINVISTNPRESKSTTALNLAYTYSQLGKKVLVVDFDFRLPTIHKKLKVKNTKGITDVISGQNSFEETVIHYTDNMDILLSGTKMPFAAEFIQSKAVISFIEGLKRSYDLIILDCPPVGLVTDGIIASQYSDGTILCLASNRNERKELERTKDLLEQMNVNILGIVMTRVPVGKKYYDYSYGYHGYVSNDRKKKK